MSPHNKGPIRLLLAGVGPHATRFYIPTLRRLQDKYNVEVVAATELASHGEEVTRYCRQHLPNAELVLVPPFTTTMPEQVTARLNSLRDTLKINGVIIATDPLAHKPYALWALSHGLDILMDKPITTQEFVTTRRDKALAVEADYQELCEAWQARQTKQSSCFVICAHRRYHPGINRVLEEIRDVSGRTGCPVTNIHSYHCDGQWRLPHEIAHQDHHSYHRGYGKVSHSGYHFLDCVFRFIKASQQKAKWPDQYEVVSNFVMPDGLLQHMTRDDLTGLFGEAYAEACPYDDGQLSAMFATCGEVDADLNIRFLKQGTAVCNANISLLHNGFSRRSWLQPGTDLYKGNGRVKHESHRIHVGPFLGIQIHSYQAKDKHERNTEEDLDVGGNNHFDVVFFRNANMLGGGKALERLSLHELAPLDNRHLFIEEVKQGAVIDFFEFMCGRRPVEALTSNIDDHGNAVRLLSSVYLSHIQREEGENPVVRRELI